MKIKVDLNAMFCILCFLVLFAVLAMSGAFKYVLFGVFILLMCIYYGGRVKSNKLYYGINIALPAIVCSFIGLFVAIINSNISIDSIKEVIFVLLPPLGAIILWSCIEDEDYSNLLDYLFLAISIYSVYHSVNKYISIGNTESQYAFVFGMFTIYYFIRNKKLYVILSILLMIIGNKRIALAATVVGIVVYFVIRRKYRTNNIDSNSVKNTVRIIGIIVVVACLAYVYLCYSGKINYIFSNNNINSMGRLEVWNYIRNYYNFSITYFGRGLGEVARILEDVNYAAFSRLHNDILVYYIELGLIGFILYISSFFYMINGWVKKVTLSYMNAIALVIINIYTLVLYCTDNISIYINYIFPVYCVMLTFIDIPQKK